METCWLLPAIVVGHCVEFHGNHIPSAEVFYWGNTSRVLQSLVAGSAKGKSYQYPRGKPTSIWENQGKSTNVIQYFSRESHWFPYCFLDLLEGSCGLVKSGEAQVLKSFNHQKSFHRVWDVYDEMIRGKAGNATAPPPSKKGGAEDIIVVSVIRKSWKYRSARVTLLMTPHIHCKCI